MANYEEKTVLMDEATSKRAVSRIAYEIVERNRGTENLVIIGIQTKGVSLAKLIIKKIEEIEGFDKTQQAPGSCRKRHCIFNRG